MAPLASYNPTSSVINFTGSKYFNVRSSYDVLRSKVNAMYCFVHKRLKEGINLLLDIGGK